MSSNSRRRLRSRTDLWLMLGAFLVTYLVVAIATTDLAPRRLADVYAEACRKGAVDRARALDPVPAGVTEGELVASWYLSKSPAREYSLDGWRYFVTEEQNLTPRMGKVVGRGEVIKSPGHHDASLANQYAVVVAAAPTALLARIAAGFAE